MTRLFRSNFSGEPCASKTSAFARAAWHSERTTGAGTLRTALAGAILLVLISTQPSAAQSIFTCKDDKGRVLTSDRHIPECSNKMMREMSTAGVVKKEIAPPLTPEQLRQREIDEEHRQLAELKRRQEDARNRALLIAFPTLASLDAARVRSINDLMAEVVLIENRIVKEYQNLKAAQAEARNQGKNVTFAVKRRIQTSSNSILADNDVLERIHADIRRTNERFDDDAKRLASQLKEPARRSSSSSDAAAIGTTVAAR